MTIKRFPRFLTSMLAITLLLGAGQVRADVVSYEFEAQDLGAIEDLDLEINESGEYAANISIRLSHLDTEVLIYGALFDMEGVMEAVFDDEAVSGLTAPKGSPEDECDDDDCFMDIIGTFVPDELLSAFDGMELGGLWTLIFDDSIEPGDGDLLESSFLSGLVSGGHSFTVDGPAMVCIDPLRPEDGGGCPSGVPEPGTLALLGLGLIGVGLLRRRRV